MAEKTRFLILFYITLFLIILAYSTTATNYDYDLWARLIAGMGFIQTGHVLKHDFLSYTPTHLWYDHEWGSGVIFYITQHLLAASGLLILQTILVFLTFFFIIKTVKLREVKTTSAYNILFYFFSFITIGYNLLNVIRCQLFSFMFFALFLYVLELARKDHNKWLFTLPFLMIIWNNLHGGCVAGIGLILLYVLGEALNKKPIKKYLYTFIASVLVLPVNPWGIDYLKFLFNAAFMPRPYIVEWFGLFSKMFFFGYLQVKIYMLILFSAEIIFIKNGIKNKSFKIDATKFLIIFATLIMAVMHVKLVPFLIIAMTCFLYDDFYTVFNSLTKNIFNKKIGLIKDISIYSLILICSVLTIKPNFFKPLINFDKYPVLQVEFIKINKLKGNILTNFGQGSYVSYKLYPQNKIYMDGRYEEVYYNDLISLLKNFHMGEKGWDELLKKYPTDLIIIEKFYPVYSVLSKNKNWGNLVEDKKFALFVKKEKLKKDYKLPSLDIKDYENRIFDTDINFVLQSENDTEK